MHVKSCILANAIKCFVAREKILCRVWNIKTALEDFSRFRAIRRNNCDGHTMYESIFIATNVISSSFLEFGTPELDLRHAILMCKIHEKVRFSWWCRTSDANEKFWWVVWTFYGYLKCSPSAGEHSARQIMIVRYLIHIIFAKPFFNCWKPCHSYFSGWTIMKILIS